MISVQEAKSILESSIQPMNPQILALENCSSLVLADDVFASEDIPAFPQSSMDGYAFSISGLKQYGQLLIEGEMAAGSGKVISLNEKHAVRIFTGAAVPSGADTVVMQEKVRSENGMLIVEDENITVGQNVRLKGSEIKNGAIALKKGSLLSPASIGYLAGIGKSHVSVYPNPRVSIIVTGNELQQPGNKLEYGQVFESNSFALRAALKMAGIVDVSVHHASDELPSLINVLNKALENADMVLLTGGVSVGDYDFVLKASEHCGITTLFHKIKQRPGKPLFAGKKAEKIIFGLPGNPASVLTCFYQYVLVALERLTCRPLKLKKQLAPLRDSFSKPANLTQFVKGFFDGTHVAKLDAQESYRMSSFATANCLIEAGEDITHLEKGLPVEIHLLPL